MGARQGRSHEPPTQFLEPVTPAAEAVVGRAATRIAATRATPSTFFMTFLLFKTCFGFPFFFSFSLATRVSGIATALPGWGDEDVFGARALDDAAKRPVNTGDSGCREFS